MSFLSGQIGNRVGATVGKFFFDRDRVVKQLDRREGARLSKAGAFVRRTARTKLRRKVRRKRLTELNAQEAAIYAQAVARAQTQGEKPPPIWYLEHSRPGEPPRQRRGWIREHLYFVYEPSRRAVVVGPAALNSTDGEAPAALEFGGTVDSRRLGRAVYIAPRPFMRPSLEENQDRFPELFRNSLG